MNNLFHQNYEVLDMLGKGGFAHVFRAISKNNGHEVAIKKVSLWPCSFNMIHKLHLTLISGPERVGL